MIYNILFSESALKQLKKLDSCIQERILSALERIRVNPERHLSRLVGDPGYRLRVGDYRIIVDVDQAKLLVLVVKVGHRKSIYNQ